MPPEHIIQYYGPDTWEEDGSWSDHILIYILTASGCGKHN